MQKKVINQIKYSFILARCFIFFLKRGRARGKLVSSPKTILVVQLAWLGDMVCTTPVFRSIKKRYPLCRVIVLGAERNVDLLTGNVDVDRYIIWRESFVSLRNELKTEKIDFACLATPHFLSLAYLYILNIPIITVPKIKGGYSPNETISFRILRNLVLAVTHTMGMYAPREYLRLLEPIGIFSNDTTKHLSFTPSAEEQIKKFLKSHSNGSGFKVAISPSAGNKIKNWGSHRFASVADYLIDNYGSEVYIIGAKADEKEVADMISFARNSNKIVNTVNKFNLDGLKAFIKHMDLFISVDTGPIYIAEAFGVPTIDIVGPMDENEQPPRGDTHISLVAPSRKRPLVHVMNSRSYDPVLFKEAIEGITPEMVFSAIQQLKSKAVSKAV